MLQCIYEGTFSEQVNKKRKERPMPRMKQETETRMVAVPEPPGAALLQQLVQAMHPQLQAELSCHRGGVPAIFFQAGSWEG